MAWATHSPYTVASSPRLCFGAATEAGAAAAVGFPPPAFAPRCRLVKVLPSFLICSSVIVFPMAVSGVRLRRASPLAPDISEINTRSSALPLNTIWGPKFPSALSMAVTGDRVIGPVASL